MYARLWFHINIKNVIFKYEYAAGQRIALSFKKKKTCAID